MKYVIEHFEAFNKWTELEYLSILESVGHENLILTSVNPQILPTIHPDLQKISSLESIEHDAYDHKTILLLDPQAPQTLSPSDSKYTYLLFGGILGDDPPQDRTSILRKMGFERRNLGKIQMTTDTAVLTAQKIVQGTRIEELKFIDHPEVRVGKKESVTLPFRYLVKDDKPIIAKGILDLIKAQNNQALEF
jgi:ribosome biogenesis SPOUT family RNA methylase Rps3